MSQRKGKTKWLSVADKERQDAQRGSVKTACLQQLHAIYSGLFDDAVLDLIAVQCGYDTNEAILQLSAMADDPQLATSKQSLHQQQPQQLARQNLMHHVIPSPASTAHPASAWRVQPPSALTASTASAPLTSHRPSPIAQPVTNSVLSSWPSPAETHHAGGTKASTSSSTNHNKSKSTVQQPYRSVLAPPLSAHSASVPAASASPMVRSAPTSPSSALQLTHNQRQASTSSTDSLSPSSAHSSSSLPDMTPAAVRSSSASAVTPSLPPSRASPQRSGLIVSIASGRRGSPLFPSLYQPASIASPTQAWLTYSAAEAEPLYYMLMVREARERMLQETEERRQAEELQEQTQPQVEEELDAFPALRIDHAAGADGKATDVEKVQVHAGELLELLRAMFGSVREELILSVVTSLDCSSINLQQLNECIDTLTAITAEQERGSERQESDIAQSVHKSAVSELSDLDIAKRMAIDPNYSPPHASTPRTLQPPQSSSTSSRRNRIKLDLSKPVHRWQPLASSESLVSPHLSAKWSIAALHTAFPRVDAALIDDMFASCGWQYEATKRALLDMFPGEMLRGEVGVLPAVLKVEERKRRPGEKERKVEERMEVDGEAVDEYDPLLDDATLEREIGPVLDNHSVSATQSPNLTSSTYANRRAAFFRAAAAAFMVGKGGLAREYAERGREESKRMDETIALHAVSVFVRANRDIDCHRSIDLHGLTVREALCILNFVVQRLKRRGVYEVVAVTGRGRNSMGGKSRLRPAVEAYCVRHKYKYHATDSEIRVMWR